MTEQKKISVEDFKTKIGMKKTEENIKIESDTSSIDFDSDVPSEEIFDNLRADDAVS